MKKVMLIIMDGVGIRKEKKGNAFKEAHTLMFNYLESKYPNTSLIASGEEVGLPHGQMGNSEVGHLNIGGGRIVDQPLQRINKSIKDGSIYQNEEILKLFKHVKDNNSNLHVFGLLSDGGVHSHIDHLKALIKMMKEEKVERVFYHFFLDGRDTLPNLKGKYLKEIEKYINDYQVGTVATIGGRYYGMDRDNRWDRVKLAYDTMIYRKGRSYKDIDSFLKDNPSEKDEFVVPLYLENGIKVNDNDGLLVFNFRPDRLRELFTAFTNPSFKEFEVNKFKNLRLVTMMSVADTVKCSNAFPPLFVKNTLGQVIANNNLKQLRIAETEKYAHVTYFFDGGEDKVFKNEERILIPSAKVKTYDLKPAMMAREITKEAIKKMPNFDFIVLNFANGDMVGHTGCFKETVEAIRVLDECLGKLYEASLKENYTLFITADHGNCEEMIDEEGREITAHTSNKVPLIITDNNVSLESGGKLGDIAPSILKYMNIDIPEEMTGKVLIK